MPLSFRADFMVLGVPNILYSPKARPNTNSAINKRVTHTPSADFFSISITVLSHTISIKQQNFRTASDQAGQCPPSPAALGTSRHRHFRYSSAVPPVRLRPFLDVDDTLHSSAEVFTRDGRFRLVFYRGYGIIWL